MRVTEALPAQLTLGVERPRSLPVLDERARGTSFLGLSVDRILNSPDATGMGFWSLNPYVGCEFGCAYCYARGTHRWVSERAELPNDERTPAERFERQIFVKQEVPTVLRRTLEPSKLGRQTLLIGTATDPYQPAERRFQVTRSVLETLAEFRGLTISITTKSPLVARDAKLLSELARRHEVSVSISLISLDAEVVRRLEPKSPLPHTRIRALRLLAKAGVEVGVLIAPIVPGLTDGWGALGGLMAAAKEAGASYAVGSALRLGDVARAGLLPLLEREYPELAARYHERYRRRHSPGSDYLAALARRVRTLQQIHGFPTGGFRSLRVDDGPSRPGSPAPRTHRADSAALAFDFGTRIA